VAVRRAAGKPEHSIFWHNRDLTEVCMSALWKEYENNVMHKIIDEVVVVCNSNYSAD